MKKLIALFLVISFIVINCATYERGEGINLSPNQKPGVKLVIQKTDSKQVRGELIAVKQNSLLLKESESGVDVSVEISEIKMIKIVKKSKALEQGGLGLLIGAVGVAACSFFLYFFTVLGMSWEWVGATEIFIEYALPYGLIGGGTIGALIGVMIGASAGKDEIIQIEGKPEAEIKKTMEELRKKARVPNFQ